LTISYCTKFSLRMDSICYGLSLPVKVNIKPNTYMQLLRNLGGFENTNISPAILRYMSWDELIFPSVILMIPRWGVPRGLFLSYGLLFHFW
jgi:hypothetical protein